MAENCFICDEKLVGKLARPECCPNHYFHRSCLTELALRSCKCPIDSKSFKQIVCKDDNQTRIDISIRKDSSSSSDEDVTGGVLLNDLAARLALAAVLHQASDDFKCGICNESGGGERAKPNNCNHEFHRRCLLNHTRSEAMCPQQGCRSEIRLIRCQHGDVLTVTNPLKEMLSRAAAGGSFRCRLCGVNDAGRERARAKPCGHEFHKGCLIERCRKNNYCPQCNREIKEINCMLSGDLTVSDRDQPCPTMWQLHFPSKMLLWHFPMVSHDSLCIGFFISIFLAMLFHFSFFWLLVMSCYLIAIWFFLTCHWLKHLLKTS